MAMESAAPARSRTLKDAWFTHLLLALVLIYIASPLAESLLLPRFPFLETILSTALLTWLMVAAVRVSSTRPLVHRIAALVAGASIGCLLLFEVVDSPWFLVAGHLGFESVLILATLTIGSVLAATREVNGHTIRAAICFYLMVAILWAFLYSILSLLDPDAFALSDSLREAGAAVELGTRNTSYAFYFSIVTMTTLGYGDISPVSESARVLAGTQAVFGQFFLAIVVARLVSLYTVRDRDRAAGQPPESN